MAKGNSKAFYVKLAVGGTVFGGLALLAYYLFVRPSDKEEEILELLEDAERELNELVAYTMRIAGEGIPEEVYSAVIEVMQAEITGKLEKAKELVSETRIIDRIRETLHQYGMDIAEGLLTAVLAIGAIYAAALIIKQIFKHIRRPPNYPCSKCGRTFSSETALRNHVKTEHQVTPDTALIAQAQLQFQSLPAWVQAGVATEAGVYDRAYERWEYLTPAELQIMAIACVVLVACLVTGAPATIAVLLLI